MARPGAIERRGGAGAASSRGPGTAIFWRASSRRSSPSWRRSSPSCWCWRRCSPPLIAPHSPFDLRTISIMDANLPPAWRADGDAKFPLGTDNQGRDILSTILYGMRISIGVGVLVGRRRADARRDARARRRLFRRRGSIRSIMRIADVQLTFPAILTALLVDGVRACRLGSHAPRAASSGVLVLAIGLSYWVQYARTVRGSTMVERNKDYVAGGTAHRPAAARHHVPARAAERHRAGARHRDDQPRARDHHRGDAVLPRRRPAADPALARHA